ncbi:MULTISPECIES: hypothetical protein [unclassified Streptomyces]|uniref:hypothetical protein n=1 Tax=unclassified Streptomyces TaxID=2593676 RepID=UPI0033BED65B
MINELDSIDWSSMSHAYGPAGDVPVWLREKASADPDVRDKALSHFYSAAHHQHKTTHEALAQQLVSIQRTSGRPGAAQSTHRTSSLPASLRPPTAGRLGTRRTSTR